jgi:uncharacterized membrane protein
MENKSMLNSIATPDCLDMNELLPEQVIKNIEAISNHQDRYLQNSTAHQRGLDKIAAIFSQPQFLYSQIGFFTIWWICSYLSNRHILPADFPLFDLREEGLSLAGLLISTGVLIYQTRQEKVSEERSHLMLQLNQFEVEIELEDKVIAVSAAAITIANAAPATSILAQGSAGVVFNDGMLDLTIIAPATPLIAIATAFDLLSSTLRGMASQREEVGFLRSNRFKITTTPPQKVVLDGEIIGMTPIDVECIPGGLTIFAPQTEEIQPLERLEGLPNLKIEMKT